MSLDPSYVARRRLSSGRANFFSKIFDEEHRHRVMSFRVRTRRSAHFIEPCLPSPMAAVAPKFALGSVTSRPFEVVPCQKSAD